MGCNPRKTKLHTGPEEILLQESTSIFQRIKICLLLALSSYYFFVYRHKMSLTFSELRLKYFTENIRPIPSCLDSLFLRRFLGQSISAIPQEIILFSQSFKL
jgi:hypothetical protein